MTDTADELALHAALDLDPSDQDTRRVLADIYEDVGDMVMADGLRWIADAGVRSYWGPGGWAWYRQIDSSPLNHCDLHAVIYDAIPSPEVWRAANRVKCFLTRRAAEEALCLAVVKAVSS